MEIRIYGSDSQLSGGTKHLDPVSGTTAHFDFYYGDISNTTGIPNGFITGATNAGSIGQGIFKQITNENLDFYRLSGGTNVTLTLNGDTIVLDSPDIDVDNNYYVSGSTYTEPTENNNSSSIKLRYIGNGAPSPGTYQHEITDTFVKNTLTLADNQFILSRNDNTEVLKLSGGTNTTLRNPTGNTIVVDVDIPSEYLTQSEGNDLYVNVTGDTMTGKLTITSSDTGSTASLIVSGNTNSGFYAQDSELLLEIDPTSNNEITIGRSLFPHQPNSRALNLGDGTHVWNNVYTEGIRLQDNSADDGIQISTPSNLDSWEDNNPVYTIVVPQTTGGTGTFLGVYDYGASTTAGGASDRAMNTGWFSLGAGTNVTLDTSYAASGSTITINTTGGSGSITGATNIGGGTELYSSTVNDNTLQFRTLSGTSPYKITTAVNGDKVEFDIDEPKMTLWPLVVTGNKLISGGAAYLSGLDFSISPLVYIIGDTIYNYSGGTITLSSGDTTYDRIDVIYADDNSTVGVIEGTPAPNPAKPEVGTTQVEVTFVTVEAGATNPAVTITKIYDEALGSGSGEWDVTASDNSTIFTGSTTEAFSGTKSIELSQAPLGDYFNFNIPGGYDTSNDNILSFYARVPSTGSWDDKRDLRITLLSGTTTVGGGGTPVVFGTTEAFGFDKTQTDIWFVLSISLGTFVMTQPIVTDVKFEVVQQGSGGGANTIDAYIDLVRFQQGAATASPQNLWLSFKTDDNIVTIAETNNEQLTVVGGSNIDTSGNNTSKSLTIDVVDNPYFNNLSAHTLTVTGDTKLNGKLTVEGQTFFKDQTTFGNSVGDNVSFDFTARINGNFIPVNNPGGDIGSPTKYWNNFYVNNISASTINISNVGSDTPINNLGIDANGNVVNGTDYYVTGGTKVGNSIEIGRTDTAPILTLSGGSNVTITNPLTDTFLIQSTDTGEVNTASNVGVGTGIFSGKSNSDLQFYSISGGSNTTVTLNNNTLVIDSTGGGSALTVEEIDGTPSVSNVDTIRFSNGSVTDDGGGQVTVEFSGATGGGLNEEAKIFSWFMNVT